MTNNCSDCDFKDGTCICQLIKLLNGLPFSYKYSLLIVLSKSSKMHLFKNNFIFYSCLFTVPEDPRRVIVTELALIIQGREDVALDLTGNVKLTRTKMLHNN